MDKIIAIASVYHLPLKHPVHKLLLIYLTYVTDDDGFGFLPSQKWLCLMMSVSRKVILSSWKALVAGDYVHYKGDRFYNGYPFRLNIRKIREETV